jgi:hypothetical protein
MDCQWWEQLLKPACVQQWSMHECAAALQLLNRAPLSSAVSLFTHLLLRLPVWCVQMAVDRVPVTTEAEAEEAVQVSLAGVGLRQHSVAQNVSSGCQSHLPLFCALASSWALVRALPALKLLSPSCCWNAAQLTRPGHCCTCQHCHGLPLPTAAHGDSVPPSVCEWGGCSLCVC